MKNVILILPLLLTALNSRADIVCKSEGKINKDGIIAVAVNTSKKTANFAILREDTMQIASDFGWYYLGSQDKLKIDDDSVVGKYMNLQISNKASKSKSCETVRGCKEATLTATTSIKVAKIEGLKVHCSAPSKAKNDD